MERTGQQDKLLGAVFGDKDKEKAAKNAAKQAETDTKCEADF